MYENVRFWLLIVFGFGALVLGILAATGRLGGKTDPPPPPPPPPEDTGPNLISVTDFLTCADITRNLTDRQIQFLNNERRDFLINLITAYQITDCDEISDEAVFTVMSVGEISNVYTYNNNILDGDGSLYCGFFREQKELSSTISDNDEGGRTRTIELGCECVPVEIENGTFDTNTCDYSCNEGYEKWFDANNSQYKADEGLLDDIDADPNKYLRSLPEGESYCIPVLGSTRPCPNEFDTTAYKQTFQMYANEKWSHNCYAKSQDDCQDGFNFQAVAEVPNGGTCVAQPVHCMPGRTYPVGDPCYTAVNPSTQKWTPKKGCNTIETCDTTCKISKYGGYNSQQECENHLKSELAKLQALQTFSPTDTPVYISSQDTKPCTGDIDIYCASGPTAPVNQFYLTQPDKNGFKGLYLKNKSGKKHNCIVNGKTLECWEDTPLNNDFKNDSNFLMYKSPVDGTSSVCKYDEYGGIYCDSTGTYGKKPVVVTTNQPTYSPGPSDYIKTNYCEEKPGCKSTLSNFKCTYSCAT